MKPVSLYESTRTCLPSGALHVVRFLSQEYSLVGTGVDLDPELGGLDTVLSKDNENDGPDTVQRYLRNYGSC